MPAKSKIPVPDGIPRKPMLFAASPWDDERIDDLEKLEGTWDAHYVPGYGELRVENALRMQKRQPQIPHNRLYWARVAEIDGRTVAPNDEQMLSLMQLGYHSCGVDDLESNGCGMPPNAHVGADGLIRRGDLALFICSDKRANFNERKRQERAQIVSRAVIAKKSADIYRVKDEERETRGSLRELADTQER